MNDLNTETSKSDYSHIYSKPQAHADDRRFTVNSEPISTSEYLKLLGFCMLALAGVGVLIFVLAYFVS